MFIQDKNFNFVEIKNKEISEIIKDKFVVAFDFDGVVTNPHELKTKYINELGYNIKPEQCERYNCIRFLGMPIEDYEQGSRRANMEHPAKLPLEDNFIANFNKLKNLERIASFFITSRSGHMIPHLESYIRYHGIKVDGIFHTQNKNKIEPLKLIDAKMFVEDSPFKLKQILSESSTFYKKCELILYRNIANKFEKNPRSEYIVEIDNCKDLADLIIKRYQEFFATFSNSSSDISR